VRLIRARRRSDGEDTRETRNELARTPHRRTLASSLVVNCNGVRRASL